MKNSLNRITLLLLVMHLAVQGIAQTISPPTPDGGGVEGKIALFLGRHIAHPATTHAAGIVGYNVYRADQKGEFKKQNKKAIAAPKSVKELEEAIGDAGMAFIINQKKLSGPEQLMELIRASADTNMAVALTLVNKPVAVQLGVLWYDETVKEEETYRYCLTYVFKDGKESEPSPELSLACCAPEDALQQVWYPKVDSKIRSIRDSTAVRDTTYLDYGTQINFYGDSTGKLHHLYRGLDFESGLRRITQLPIMPPSDPSQPCVTIDTGLIPLQFYYYCVSTEDRWGNKVFSDTMPVRVLPNKPLIPQKIKAKAMNEGIRVSWEKVESPYLNGYFLMRRVLFGAVYDSLGQIIPGEKEDASIDSLYEIRQTFIPSTDTLFFDTQVRAGLTYAYKIMSIDEAKQLSSPSAYSKVKFENTTPPSPPVGLRGGVANNEYVMLTWQANKEIDVLQYRVYRALGQNMPSAFPTLIEADSNGLILFTDSSNLVQGATYQYAVQALNTSGYESELSAPISLTIKDMSPPAAPASLSATRDWALGHRIEWGTPTDERTYALSLYRTFCPLGTPIEDTTLVYEKIYEEGVSLGTYAYRDTASIGKRGIICRYRMKAMTVDSIYSDFSSALSVVVPEPLLQAATRLEVFREGESIKVQWIPTYQKNLQGYIVYRRGYNSPEKVLNQKPISPKEATFLIDNELKVGESYYYRVVPVSKQGVQGKSSKEINYRVTPKK